MWRYKILKFKESHPVVICKYFAQSLRGSCGSSNLSFMSLGLWRYATFPALSRICRKLSFNNLSILRNIKILLIIFCQKKGFCLLCAKFQIGEIAQKEFEKDTWPIDEKKKTEAEMGVAYITRFSIIQGTHRYK